MANLPTDAVINGKITAKVEDVYEESVGEAELGAELGNLTLEELYATCEKGDKGETVKIVQKYLMSEKYSIGKSGVDGKFGNDLQSAVKKYQKDHKLKVTGIWDEATAAYTVKYQKKKAADAAKKKKEEAKKKKEEQKKNEAMLGTPLTPEYDGGKWTVDNSSDKKKKDPKPTLTIKNDKTIVVKGQDGKTYKFTFNSGVPERISGIGKLNKTYTKKFTAEEIAIIRNAASSQNQKDAVNTWRDEINQKLEGHAGTLPKRPATGIMPAVYFSTSTSISGQNAQAVGSSDEEFGLYDPELNGNGNPDPLFYNTPTTNEDRSAVLFGGVYTNGKQTGRCLSSTDAEAVTSYLGQIYGDGKVRDAIIHSLGLYEGDYMEMLERNAKFYNRFKMKSPDTTLQRGFAHVFFVKPDCNILFNKDVVEQVETLHDSDFSYLYYHSPHILKELTCNVKNNDSDFSMILSNAASSFSLQDEFIDTDTTGMSYIGYKIAFGRHNAESQTAGEFTITFDEDKDCNIYKLLHMWVHYIAGTFRGRFQAKQETIDQKVMDYAGAVYYFLTAEDGETILFWSKYYGVFPSTIPSTQYSWSKGTLLAAPTLDVTFKFSFKEDFNTDALVEFNKNAHVAEIVNENEVPYENTFDSDKHQLGKTWTGAPFVETNWDNGNCTFKLRFRKSNSD